MQDKWRKVEHCMERAETSTGLGEEVEHAIKWRKVEHRMEKAETSTGLDGEGGACKTSGGRWSTAWRELPHQQVWVEKMEHARQVEEGGALFGES